MESIKKSKKDLLSEIEELNRQLEEANETIEAIRTGKVDALVVHSNNGHQLYTLKTADQTYRVFIEKMREGAVTLDVQGIVVYSNSRFATMVNLPLSKVVGQHFIDFVAEENKLHFAEIFKNCWSIDCKEELILHGVNTAIPVQLSISTLDLDEGISLSIIVTDLSIQKETQTQLSAYNDRLEITNLALENSNHDLQQFASVASHDLQEPLRKIQIFSNLLNDKFRSAMNDESTTYLDKIINSAARMKLLITDILNYSSLSSELNKFTCVDLNLLIADVLQDFDLIVQEKNANIMVSKLPEIIINKGQMRQVFQNIISNALKFTRPGVAPVISISSKRINEKAADSEEDPDGQFHQISLLDNGIGLNEQYTMNIFALFERLHPKDKYEGTGIGLAIAKKIIEKHNGSIHVKSKEGEGAEFIIILPVSQGQC